MSMLELVVAMVVLLVAVGGSLSAISSLTLLSESSRERTLALAAAQDMLEQLGTEPFASVFARYNGDPADDVGPGAPGEHFDVTGLSPSPADADGRVGRVLFAADPLAPTALFENRVDAAYGMPRDLSGDGVVDALDHAGDYRVLPVRVLVEWRGRTGNRRCELSTLLHSP